MMMAANQMYQHSRGQQNAGKYRRIDSDAFSVISEWMSSFTHSHAP